MPYNFPEDPELNDVFNHYTWDGEKWIFSLGGIAALYGPVNVVLPVITGTLQVYQVLSSTTGTWTGSGTLTYTYQWKRDGANISGATGATYSLAAADEAKMISVVVTATNLQGSTSATSVSVGAILPAPSPPTILTGLLGWWDASVPASLNLTGANVNSIADQSGGGRTMTKVGTVFPTYNATGYNGGLPAIVFAGNGGFSTGSGFPMGSLRPLTAWFVGTLSGDTAGAIPKSRMLNYTSPGGGDGSSGWVLFRAYNTSRSVHWQTGVQSANTAATLTAYPKPHRIIVTVDTAPTIKIYVDGVQMFSGGTPHGGWITAGTARIGTQEDTSNFWVGPVAECGIAAGFANATAVAQLDNYLAHKWSTVITNATLPVINGFLNVGAIVAASDGTWNGSEPTSFTYQWKKNGVAISGATSRTYQLDNPLDLGAMISCDVVASNWGNSSAVTTTAAVGPIDVALPPGHPATLPNVIGWWDASVTASMSLTGSNINSIADMSGGGNTLTATGTKPVYNATGFNGSTKPTMVFTYSPLYTATSTFPMGGGNTLTFWIVGTLPDPSAHSNCRFLSCGDSQYDFFYNFNWCLSRNSYDNDKFVFTRAQNNAIGTTTAYPAPHRFIGTINSSGVMTIYIDGVAAGTATCTGNWVAMGTLRVGIDNSGGGQFVGRISEIGVTKNYSDATTVGQLDAYLASKWATPLANTVAPVITGFPNVGSILSASDGTWTGSPPTGFTYQWKRDGANIGGATAKYYTLVSGDLATMITVTMVASNWAGAAAPITSTGIGPIAAALPAGHPGTLAGLTGWWDTSVTASLTLSGANVNAIADQSGLGNTITGLSQKPQYSATAFNASTKPAMVFNSGSGTGIASALGFPIGTGNTLTMWYVGTMPISGGTGRAFSYNAPGQLDWNNAGSCGIGGNQPNCFLIRSSVQSTYTASASPAPHRFIATISATGVITMYVDGVANTPATSAGNWVTGGKVSFGQQGGTDFWGGTIAEAGIATGFHDATAVAALDTFLKNKWGM